MKIALIDPALFTWPYDRELAGAMDAAGHELRLYGRHLPPGATGAGDPLLRQLYYPALRHPGAARLPRALGRLAKGIGHWSGNNRLHDELAAWQPQAIHFQWLPLPVLDVLALRRLRSIAPLVLTVHDTVPFNGTPGSRLQGLAFHDALRLFDTLVVHTEQGRRRVQERLGPSAPVVRIPHGLLHDDGRPRQVPSAGDRVTILLFGKLKPYKGLDLLIRAVAVLPPLLRAKLTIRVVGQPQMDMAPLTDMIVRLGVGDCFDLQLDFVPDDVMAAHFAAADALVFPYREIEASGVLMAAIAHERPIIASRMGAFAELLEHGRDGLLFPPGDVRGLAGVLAWFIRSPDLRATMARSVGSLRAAIPGWDRIAARTVQVYAGLHVGRKAGRPSAVAPAKRPAPGT